MVNALDKKSKEEIARAIADLERFTHGEICVHLKAKCKKDPLENAKKVFRRLKMHRTKGKSGILIFIALQSHSFAILGDSGIHEKVGDEFWDQTRDIMVSYFSKGEIAEGILAGVRSAGEKLKLHFPSKPDNPDELPNTVTES